MLMAGQKTKIKFKKWLAWSRDVITSLLFPPRCLVCDEILEPGYEEKGIHPACESKLYPIFGAVCMHCGRPLGEKNPRNKGNEYEFETWREYCYDCMRKEYTKQSNIVQGKSLFLYKGAIKNTMYQFKYNNKREYADYLARDAVKKHGEWIKHVGVEVIVPVPMYAHKQRKRGYNQAACFAKELCRLTGISMEQNLVYRVLDTIPQKGLSEKERKNNLEKAFQKGKNVVQYNCALVVDDIYTTGSTAEAVARELIKQGTHRVYLLTVCIGGDV